VAPTIIPGLGRQRQEDLSGVPGQPGLQSETVSKIKIDQEWWLTPIILGRDQEDLRP
jgi:hypothetical protein